MEIEMEKEKKWFLTFAAQFDSLIETHSQTNDLAIDNATVIDRSNRVLLGFLYKPAARAANDARAHIVSIIVKNINGIELVFGEKRFHFARGRPPKIVVALANELFAGECVQKTKIVQGFFQFQTPRDISGNDHRILGTYNCSPIFLKSPHIVGPSGAEFFH